MDAHNISFKDVQNIFENQPKFKNYDGIFTLFHKQKTQTMNKKRKLSLPTATPSREKNCIL